MRFGPGQVAQESLSLVHASSRHEVIQEFAFKDLPDSKQFRSCLTIRRQAA